MKELSIAIASGNPAKVEPVSTVLNTLGLQFTLSSIAADSGVSAQPMTLSETRLGAINRAQAASAGFDIGIGLEGGVYELEGQMYLCNWGALATADGRIYTAAGAQIPLPGEIAEKLLDGHELGPVMDVYANEVGIRHHKGAIGILTGELVNRHEMFEQIVKLLMGQYLQYSD